MYGDFFFRREKKRVKIRAHVYSWKLHNKIEFHKDVGLVVMHSCDHPYCVNPDHLSLGTHRDNAQDRNRKGRQARGEKHGRAKLTEAKVREIRELRTSGVSIPQLSYQFGVGIRAIERVIHHRTWKHVI